MDHFLSTIHSAAESFSFTTALLVFIAYVVVDALFAKYTIEVSQLDEWRSATTGILTHFLLVFGVINYTQNWLYVIPLAVGSWIGTFYMVRKERLKNERITIPTREA